MTFDERRDRALAIMARTPVPPHRYAPPIFQLFWRVGLQAAPPHFGHRWLWQLTNVILLACAVTPSRVLRDGGLVSWLFGIAAVAVVAAMVVARGYAREARLLELPAWEDLDGEATRPGSILGLSEPTSASDRDR